MFTIISPTPPGLSHVFLDRQRPQKSLISPMAVKHHCCRGSDASHFAKLIVASPSVGKLPAVPFHVPDWCALALAATAGTSSHIHLQYEGASFSRSCRVSLRPCSPRRRRRMLAATARPFIIIQEPKPRG
eukprot:SAG31_NODE_1861_length_7044_cov_169.866379_3_plen_130_part_00